MKYKSCPDCKVKNISYKKNISAKHRPPKIINKYIVNEYIEPFSFTKFITCSNCGMEKKEVEDE